MKNKYYWNQWSLNFCLLVEYEPYKSKWVFILDNGEFIKNEI